MKEKPLRSARPNKIFGFSVNRILFLKRYRKEEALGIDNTNTPMHMREQWRKHAEDADRGYMMIPKSGIWYQPFYQPFNDPRNEEVEPPIRTIPADDPKPKE